MRGVTVSHTQVETQHCQKKSLYLGNDYLFLLVSIEWRSTFSIWFHCKFLFSQWSWCQLICLWLFKFCFLICNKCRKYDPNGWQFLWQCERFSFSALLMRSDAIYCWPKIPLDQNALSISAWKKYSALLKIFSYIQEVNLQNKQETSFMWSRWNYSCKKSSKQALPTKSSVTK